LDAVRRSLPELPETEIEVRSIAKILGATSDDVHVGTAATETKLKALSAAGRLVDYRVVAFATHGLVAGEIGGLAEPAIVLTLPEKASGADDGLLTASEVAALRLDADWVILSACNTAAGSSKSAEALSGLARAFMFAGARAILVSHWAVESEAAVKLTTGALARIAADQTTGRAEAMRRAMVDLIDNGPPHAAHPAYWAPFFLVGEGAGSTPSLQGAAYDADPLIAPSPTYACTLRRVHAQGHF
ncbi:MAG: CHAT domain-containing protein, partial [Vicinamibacterales bacterium]